jgi:adenylate kinase family enzyme
MDSGAFVPDELIVDLLVQSLAEAPKDSHLLLDGFPRTVPQALALDKHLTVDVVVNLDIPKATIVERLTDRYIN